MGRLVQPATKAILSAKAADGTGNAINVEDFRHVVLKFSSASNAALKVNFQASIEDDQPDFSAAQSASNFWDYVQVRDLEDASTVDGDTGITLSGTDDHRQLEVNTNLIKWICATVSSHSAGSITVEAKMSGE